MFVLRRDMIYSDDIMYSCCTNNVLSESVAVSAVSVQFC